MATYTRLGQACGELRYEREWIARYTQGTASVRTTSPNTGNACIETTGNGGFGFGFVIPQGAHTRGGGHFQYPAVQAHNVGSMMYFPIAGVADTYHEIRLDLNTQTLAMYIDNNLVESISLGDATISPDTWINFGWNLNPNQWFIFYIAKTAVLSYSGLMNTNVAGCFFGDYSVIGLVPQFYFDDVWIDQVEDETTPVRPPRRIFLPSYVTSPGTYDDWTPSGAVQNYQCVDDATTPDGDTTHNYSDTADQRDTFNMTPIAVPSAGEGAYWKINAVIPQAVVRKPNPAEEINLSLITYDGLNFGVGDAEEYIGPDYLVFWHRFPLEPDLSAWSEDDINSGMEVGYLNQSA